MAKQVLSSSSLLKFFLLGLLTLINSATVLASDIDIGREIYNKNCVSCHGANAQGNDGLGGPALAGQNKNYLIRQLANFSQGRRGSDKSDSFGQQMAAMISTIKAPASQADVSAYLSSLGKPSTSVTEEKTGGGSNIGYKTYQASCGACHGADASGNERLNSPSLVGLSTAYLSRQYANFLGGSRGSHQSDKLGRQMQMIAGTLTDQDKIDATIAYIVSLRD